MRNRLRYNIIESHNTHTQADTTLFYDANGNMISDKDRGIALIKYNHLNLPDTIQFLNGNQIVHLYDAAGVKYKSIYFTLLPTASTPYDEIAHYTFNSDTVEYYITEYAGNIENYYSRYDILRRIFNTEGYFERDTLYCYYKDHLGNNVAVRNMMSDSIVQQTVYYASGLPMAQSTSVGKQSYKYNGKEFVEMHGLDEYDSQARWYYPAIVRTTTMDPMAESYYHLSPYAWCGNNPTTKIDTDGQYYFDWDDWCYRSDYGNHDEVHFSEVLFNEFIEPRPIDQIGPLRLVGEFGLGNGMQERNFSPDDNFTQQFTTDNDRLEPIYSLVAEAIFTDGFKNSAEDKNRNYGYSLGSKKDFEKIGIKAHDAANAAGRVFNKVSPFGIKVPSGNLAASVVGSFNLTWKIKRIDNNGDAVVTFELKNTMSAGSALRPATVGYTDKWDNVTRSINRAFNSRFNFLGVMRAVQINITWTTTIKNPNKK